MEDALGGNGGSPTGVGVTERDVVGTTRRSDVPQDTTRLNAARQDFAGVRSVWLFGYGSLIYKVDFPALEHRCARLHGWARRLWQGSHDHRGTCAHPGRVATLIEAPDAVCVGVAYRIAPAVFRQLDVREKNGYLRQRVVLDFGGGESTPGIAYIAPPGNAAWLGPASDADIARQVAASVGPSGTNRAYVLKLAEALRDLGAVDPHIAGIAAHLRNPGPARA